MQLSTLEKWYCLGIHLMLLASLQKPSFGSASLAHILCILLKEKANHLLTRDLCFESFGMYLYLSLQHQVFQEEKQRLAVLPQICDGILRVQLRHILTDRPLSEDVDTYLWTKTKVRNNQAWRRKHAEYEWYKYCITNICKCIYTIHT